MRFWAYIKAIPEWVHHVAVIAALSAIGLIFW